MDARRIVAAFVPFTLLAAPAVAQMRAATLVGPLEPLPPTFPAVSAVPEFGMPRDDLQQPAQPRRNGLIAAFPVDRNVEIGLGRFRVVDPARPRTNTEFDRQPMSVRPRERGIAAIGVSLRF